MLRRSRERLAVLEPRQLVPPAIVTAAVVALVIAGAVSTPAFFTVDNALLIVRTTSLTGIAAVGMTFVTLSGAFFSLSVEQTAIVCAVVYALALSHGFGLLGALLLTAVVAVLVGAIQGAIVAAGINPIVTTLGAGAALYGFATVLSSNQLVKTHTGTGTWIGLGKPLGIPTQSWAFVFLTIASVVFLKKTGTGRRIMLVGANPEAARASGISVGSAKFIAFILSSIGAAIVGVFIAAQFAQASVLQYSDVNIDAIAAVLVGGTALQGGEGSTARTALGALFIALLSNFMLLRNYGYGTRLLVTGILVTLATALFHVLRTRNQ
jgi:ribose transport system permease protein